MKNKIKWLKRPMHLALTLLVIAILGIGTTIAFFTDIEAAVNRLTVGEIQIRTDEDVSGLTKNNVGVTSVGKSESYIRMRADIPTVTYSYSYINDGKEITVSDQQAQVKLPGETGSITASSWAELESFDTTVTRANKDDVSAKWIKKDDGFWYLSVTLNKDDYAQFLNQITYPGLLDGVGKLQLPDGLTKDMLTIPITSEAIQVENIPVDETAGGAQKAYQAFQTVNKGAVE